MGCRHNFERNTTLAVSNHCDNNLAVAPSVEGRAGVAPLPLRRSACVPSNARWLPRVLSLYAPLRTCRRREMRQPGCDLQPGCCRHAATGSKLVDLWRPKVLYSTYCTTGIAPSPSLSLQPARASSSGPPLRPGTQLAAGLPPPRLARANCLSVCVLQIQGQTGSVSWAASPNATIAARTAELGCTIAAVR
jgi:hypothetical protein